MASRRGEVFLATKLSARKGDDARRQIEASLKRLQTDRLDVLHIHSLTSLEDLAAIEAADGVLKVVQRGEGAEDRALHRHHRSREPGGACKAALERHDFDCVQMALNAARARMEFDDKGPNPGPDGRMRATRRWRCRWRSARRWAS